MDGQEFTAEELAAIFGDDLTATPVVETTPVTDTPPTDETKVPSAEDNKTLGDSVETTKAFAQRLKEKTEKAVNEERESIAKTLGFSSYDELIKSNEKKMYEDKGLDAEQVQPLVDELVKKKLEEDPRMKELEEFRKQKLQDYANKELAEITKLTGGEITKLSQLPQSVIDSWKKTGSLKTSYLEIEGEKLINRMRSEQSKGTTAHLAALGGNTVDNGKRLLNDEEKRTYKLFFPDITDDELNKKTVDK